MCKSGPNWGEWEEGGMGGLGNFTREVNDYNMIKIKIIHKTSHVNDSNNCLFIYSYIKYFFPIS